MFSDQHAEQLHMAAKDRLVDFSKIDFSKTVSSLEDIRRYNPQRYAMEQLTAIVYESREEGLCVGYKDTSPDDFWVAGHMPGMPLMPGVIMCEAAAQLSSYYVQKHDLLGADVVGLGGLEEIRFRGAVRPGDRLVVAAKQIQLRRGAMIICRFECYVGENLVCEGKIKGVALPVAELKAKQP